VPVTLRELDAGDADAFWQLRLRGFADEPASFGSSYEEASQRPLADVARELRSEGLSPDDFVLGAFAGDALVAITGLRRERRLKRSHRAELWGMHVAREHRRQGIGRTVLLGVLERAQRIAGLEQVLLTVMAANPAAIALYASAGFTRYGFAPKAMRLDGRWFDEELMRLELR